jgi:uncharacterized protein
VTKVHGSFAVLVDVLLLVLAHGVSRAVVARMPVPDAYAPVAHALLVAALMLCVVALRLRTAALPAGGARAYLGLVHNAPWRELLYGVLFAGVLYLVATAALLPLVLLGGKTLQASADTKRIALGALRTIPLPVRLGLAVLAGVYEEIVFRGFLLGRLVNGLIGSAAHIKGRVATRIAVVFSAILFSLGHAYQGPVGMVQTLVVGLLLGWLRLRRGSLFAPIGSHLAIDIVGMVALESIPI